MQDIQIFMFHSYSGFGKRFEVYWHFVSQTKVLLVDLAEDV